MLVLFVFLVDEYTTLWTKNKCAPTRIFPNLFCPTLQLSIKRMEKIHFSGVAMMNVPLFGRVFSYSSSHHHGSEHTGAVEDVSCLSQKMVICHGHDCWREETSPPATSLLFFPQSWKWKIAHLETKLIFLDPIFHFHEYRRESKKHVCHGQNSLYWGRSSHLY